MPKPREEGDVISPKEGLLLQAQSVSPSFKEWFISQYGEGQYDLFLKLKKALDPNNILSPMD